MSCKLDLILLEKFHSNLFIIDYSGAKYDWFAVNFPIVFCTAELDLHCSIAVYYRKTDSSISRILAVH